MERRRHDREPSVGSVRDTTRFAEVKGTVEEYFDGTLTGLRPAAGAAGYGVPERVWTALRDIPYGETISYQELAHRIGKPRRRCAPSEPPTGRNPISIIMPCHRVIGADGSLTGYGGGIERKRWLLASSGQRPLPL